MSASNVTYMRCHKVEKALETDPAIRKMLGPKEHIMHKPPNNTPCKFSAEVIAITEVIHGKGLDAHTMTQREIMAHAMPFLLDRQDGKPMPKIHALQPAQGAPMPKAKVKAAARPPAKPKAKPRPKPPVSASPKAERVTQPIVDETPAAAKADANGQTVPEPAAPARHVAKQRLLPAPVSNGEEVVDEPVAQEEPEPEPEVEEAEAPLPKQVLDDARSAPSGRLPYVWGVAVNTLLKACVSLMESENVSDSSLYKRFDELINTIDKLTVLPRTGNAKEIQNSDSRGSAS